MQGTVSEQEREIPCVCVGERERNREMWEGEILYRVCVWGRDALLCQRGIPVCETEVPDRDGDSRLPTENLIYSKKILSQESIIFHVMNLNTNQKSRRPRNRTSYQRPVMGTELGSARQEQTQLRVWLLQERIGGVYALLREPQMQKQKCKAMCDGLI